MKFTIYFLWIFSIILENQLEFCSSARPNHIGTVQEEIQSLNAAQRTAEQNNHFSIKLYNELRKSSTGPGNLIFSPFSLRSVMAMLQSGAEGSTAEEISRALMFPSNNTELFEGYRALLTKGDYVKPTAKSSSTYPVIIEQGNRIYIKKGFEIHESFQKILKHYFQSPVQQISFTNSKKAATEINNWISDQTHNRIQKLIESDALNNFTKMVLVNTLYFKGPWENKFHGRLTRQRPFYLEEGQNVLVDMMTTEDYFPVHKIESLDAKAIILPYEKLRFQMIIFLPNQKFGLEEMERKLVNLESLELNQIFQGFQESSKNPKNIILSIPKFSIESTHELIDTLKQMNVHKVFNENESDLSGIGKTDEKLYVSKLVQKAFLTVEEQGSEAGAATYGAVFTPLSIGPSIDEEIHVDHPFLGLIWDSKSQLVLFMFRKSKF